MLFQRGVRPLVTFCRPSILNTLPPRVRIPALQQTATTWYVNTPQTSISALQYSTKGKDDIKMPDIKMPSRDQVEKYFFTALVYIWDVTVYIVRLTLHLVDTYILKNPRLKEYWNRLVKRLDEQRDAIKKK